MDQKPERADAQALPDTVWRAGGGRCRSLCCRILAEEEQIMAATMTTELESGGAVRAHYDAPHEVALRKQMKQLDRHCRAFIAVSPFVVIATADAHGRADASPRG